MVVITNFKVLKDTLQLMNFKGSKVYKTLKGCKGLKDNISLKDNTSPMDNIQPKDSSLPAMDRTRREAARIAAPRTLPQQGQVKVAARV